MGRSIRSKCFLEAFLFTINICMNTLDKWLQCIPPTDSRTGVWLRSILHITCSVSSTASICKKSINE